MQVRQAKALVSWPVFLGKPFLMRQQHLRGFTLVELIVVIVLVGIVSTVAVSRFANTRQFDAAAYAQEVRSIARFGQKLAIAQNRAVFFSTAASRAALCYDAACTQPVGTPAGSNSGHKQTVDACGNPAWMCEGLPGGLAMDAAPAPAMFFNAQGRPFAAGDAPATDLSTFATLTITIGGGDTPQVVTIERETGYVH